MSGGWRRKGTPKGIYTRYTNTGSTLGFRFPGIFVSVEMSGFERNKTEI
ncbi:MAG: hypothetical protein Q4C96_00785 [Planctomycetia bacterium]|nr:hypothetical protein [Planctomycetia bacterium]